jgi:hypothetical protein
MTRTAIVDKRVMYNGTDWCFINYFQTTYRVRARTTTAYVCRKVGRWNIFRVPIKKKEKKKQDGVHFVPDIVCGRATCARLAQCIGRSKKRWRRRRVTTWQNIVFLLRTITIISYYGTRVVSYAIWFGFNSNLNLLNPIYQYKRYTTVAAYCFFVTAKTIFSSCFVVLQLITRI